MVEREAMCGIRRHPRDGNHRVVGGHRRGLGAVERQLGRETGHSPPRRRWRSDHRPGLPGGKDDVRDLEPWVVERNPGPLNYERWAGSFE